MAIILIMKKEKFKKKNVDFIKKRGCFQLRKVVVFCENEEAMISLMKKKRRIFFQLR